MKSKEWGVVVARLQTPDLHEGHLKTIGYALERHYAVMVVLGVRPAPPTPNDPLDFETRKKMVYITYPGVIVKPMPNHRSNSEWSKNLDRLIEAESNGHGAVLYGSRDSFIKVYSGTYPTVIVPEVPNVSATMRRAEAKSKVLETSDFRAGQIYAIANAIRPVYPTVDIAVVDRVKRTILLGQKAMDGGKLRFIGGFVDPKDESFEAAAKREVMEETSHIEVDNVRYLGSAKIDDWRYEGSGGDSVMSSFFAADYIFGAPQAADDLDGLRWVPVEELLDVIVEEHLGFAIMLRSHLEKR